MIMKTLGALKKKFDKIILITHVKELIEMFDIKMAVSLDTKGYSKIDWIKSV